MQITSSLLSADLADYKDDADAYELEERSRPDEMAMLAKGGEVAKRVLAELHDANILDFCCGTGLSLEHIVDHPNAKSVTGVDISSNYVAFAAQKFNLATNPPRFILGDAVTHPLPKSYYDLVMMASAYHHIEDDRKLAFLSRVRGLIANGGFGIFVENILPEYKVADKVGYAEAVRQFYSEVLVTAEKDNPNLPERARELIARVAKYGCDGDYEYKVHYGIFREHLETSGLQVVEEHRVWPNDGPLLHTTAGNYVLLVRSR